MKKILFLTIATMLICACGKNNDRKQSRSGVVSKSTSSQVTSIPLSKPTINVYIENSGSMDGYVKGITEFEQTIYNYLSDILISHTTDSLNLFYINSEVSKPNLALEDFIQKLEPSTFQKYGGKRGTSDIANVLETVLAKTGKNQISILVTDGIFSPGRGIDAEEYLINQQIGIKKRFADYLERTPNASVIVYQLSSKFNGTYYNKIDAKKQINEQRPYYLWVIGDAKQVSQLRKNVPDSKFIYGVQNVFTSIVGNRIVKYALKANIGTYDFPRDGSCTIKNIKKDKRTGKVQFAVNSDFSDLLLDDRYLLNITNYENNSKYILTVNPYSGQNSTYSHTFLFASTDRVYSGNIVVKLKAILPAWIEEANDDKGVTAVPEKTYGIKYQLGGVFDAFTFKDNYYTEIKININ